MSMKLGIPVAFKSVIEVRQMAMDMRRDGKCKELIDFTSKKFLDKDFHEIHLDKYVVKVNKGDYEFRLSYEWMPSGTVMEHFSVGHKSRCLVPNEAQMLAILLGVSDNQKTIQSKRGVCHYYSPVAYKSRGKLPEVGFTVVDIL